MTLANVVPFKPPPACRRVYCVPGVKGPPERVTPRCPVSATAPWISMLPPPAGVTVVTVLAVAPNVTLPAIEMVCSGASVPWIVVVVLFMIEPLPVRVPVSQMLTLAALTVPPLSMCSDPVPPGPLTLPPIDNAPPVLNSESAPETLSVPVAPALKPTLANVPLVM